MWMTEYSVESKASEANIWKVMTDVENWKKWVGGLEYSRLDGDFGDGVFGTLKNFKGPKSRFCIKDVIENKSFIMQSKFMTCTMDGIHEITNENDVVKIKLGVRIRGPLTFILKVPARSAEKSLPFAAKKLSELAEMIGK
jgi:hypothetical protein